MEGFSRLFFDCFSGGCLSRAQREAPPVSFLLRAEAGAPTDLQRSPWTPASIIVFLREERLPLTRDRRLDS